MEVTIGEGEEAKTCTECQNPNPDTWDDPTEELYGFHQGAKCCMRSAKANESGAGQQCCYDDKGKLITHGQGAGTPDRAHGKRRHQQEDVVPALIARFADVGTWGRHQEMYNVVRPPNQGRDENGDPCPENP